MFGLMFSQLICIFMLVFLYIVFSKMGLALPRQPPPGSPFTHVNWIFKVNMELVISQPKVFRLPRNKKQTYRLNTRPQMWPMGMTLAMSNGQMGSWRFGDRGRVQGFTRQWPGWLQTSRFCKYRSTIFSHRRSLDSFYMYATVKMIIISKTIVFCELEHRFHCKWLAFAFLFCCV